MSSAPVVSIGSLRDHVGQDVTLRGWLYNKRSSKKLHFLEVRDGNGIVQAVVVQGEVPDELFAQADKLAQETSLEVTGTVREHARRKGEYELGVKAFAVVSAPAGEYPITPKEH